MLNTIINAVSHEFSSLGLDFLGKSSYNPSSPDRIYFTIGEVIAFLALIIAVYQLLSPRIKFRINNARINIKFMYFLVFPACISFVFLASLLPFIPGKAIPLLSYPYFWEFMSGMFIALCFFYIFYVAITPSKINSHNYNKYFNGCYSIITKGNESELRELAEEINYSIEIAIKTCSEYNRLDYRKSEEENTPYSISDFAQATIDLFDLWSDEQFSRIIVCNAPLTAIEFFRQIQNHKFYHSGGYALVRQIIRQSLSNRSSILYRENDFQGLGHFKLFSTTVFYNIKLVESDIRPLEAWNYLTDEVVAWKIKKYFEIVNLYLGSFCFKPGLTHSWALYSAFFYIFGFTMRECIKIEKTVDSNIFNSIQHKNIEEINNGLNNSLEILVEHQDIVSDLPNVKIDDQYNGKNSSYIIDIFAETLFKYFLNLSTIKNDDIVRSLALDIWLKIFTVSDNLDDQVTFELRRRLRVLLLNKVKENLIDMFSPKITKLLISIHTLYNDNRKDASFYIFRSDFFDLLIKHYNIAYLHDESFAISLLPENTTYDVENGNLIQKTRKGGNPLILKVNKPL